MFLLRMMFWLAILVMLIPTGEVERASPDRGESLSVNGAIGAAAATVSDMAGFCDRNRQVCETGAAAVDLFFAKAENGARLAYRMLNGRPNKSVADGGNTGSASRDAVYRRNGNGGTDTLLESDRAVPWYGPADADI